MPRIMIAVTMIFFLTVLWQYLATRKTRASQLLMANAMIKEMEQMAGKLGCSRLEDYLAKTKGSESADTAMGNLRGFVASFTPKGPG